MTSKKKIKETAELLWKGSYGTEYLIKSYCDIIIDLLLDIREQNDTKSTKYGM